MLAVRAPSAMPPSLTGMHAYICTTQFPPHEATMEPQWRMCNVAGSCVGQVDVLVAEVMPGGNPTLRQLQHASLNYAS